MKKGTKGGLSNRNDYANVSPEEVFQKGKSGQPAGDCTSDSRAIGVGGGKKHGKSPKRSMSEGSMPSGLNSSY